MTDSERSAGPTLTEIAKKMRDEAVAVLQEHIKPGGRLSDHEALNRLYGIFDGPLQRAFDAAYAARAAAVPQGASVPREPTFEMIQAVVWPYDEDKYLTRGRAIDAWTTMHDVATKSAAPREPVKAEPVAHDLDAIITLANFLAPHTAQDDKP